VITISMTWFTTIGLLSVEANVRKNKVTGYAVFLFSKVSGP